MKVDGEIKIEGINEKGTAVVEFAVIVVILLAIFMGVLEFAFIFYQRHFVENAAREGMRVGIRANNFSCFDSETNGCSATVARKQVVQQKVEDYLSPLYEITNPDGQIDVIRIDEDEDAYLKVTIEVANFFPQLLSGIIPGFSHQNIISYRITGRYEDPEEF